MDDRRAPLETLTLVGILSYEKGSYAFFDGSASQHRKVLGSGGSIAGCKVAAITADAVKLQASTNTFELRIGMQLRRGEGAWQVVGGGGAVSPRTSSEPSVVADSGGDENDIVKRLMRQREDEMK